jgi:hypothetical protein
MNEIPQFLLGRKAALTALFGLMALVLLLVVAPIGASFLALHDETTDTLNQLALYRSELGSRPQLEKVLADIRQRAASGTGLIVADDSALAEAQIQREMKAIIESNAGEVRSTQVATKKRIRGLEEITVQYDLSVPLTRLSSVLYAIESHTPYLFIDHADIATPMGWPPQAGASAKRQIEPNLEVRCTVRAYRWSGK